VQLEGYVEDEKVAIARHHLLPRLVERMGLRDDEVVVTDEAVRARYDQEIAAAAGKLQRLQETLNNVLFGQETVVENVLTGVLARGHILLEGLPGLGKTELVKALSKALQIEAKRIGPARSLGPLAPAKTKISTP
jgi:ATP-dependent Lon protease